MFLVFLTTKQCWSKPDGRMTSQTAPAVDTEQLHYKGNVIPRLQLILNALVTTRWVTNSSPCSAQATEKRVSKSDIKSPVSILGTIEPGPVHDFDKIKQMCDVDDEQIVGPNPFDLANHRASNWPSPAALPEDLARIYSPVKKAGIPNALGCRIPIPSKLHLDQWDELLGKSSKYEELLDFIRFRFLMGYLGPESAYDDKYNHSSAEQYESHIEAFLEKEIELGGIVGPMPSQPFQPWINTAPLMTRPKRDSESRRVIADLSFPEQASVNGYILKNAVWGRTRSHSLPSMTEFVERVKEMGKNSYLASIDISRSYKNFRSDPLDWPLLCGYWNDAYYCDVTLPFGARASSYHTQSVANTIRDILSDNGILVRIYLDDIIILAANKRKANEDYLFVKDLLKRLGLPEAEEKSQPPARAVEWLGVLINTADMTLSIPVKKVNEMLEVVRRYERKKKI